MMDSDSVDSPSTEMVVDVLRKFVEEHGADYGILESGLFGSYARGEHRPESDMDVCIRLDRPSLFRLASMREGLVEIFGRDVELVSLRPHLSPAFRKQVLESAILVHI